MIITVKYIENHVNFFYIGHGNTSYPAWMIHDTHRWMMLYYLVDIDAVTIEEKTL